MDDYRDSHYAQFSNPVGNDPSPTCPKCQIPMIASRNFQTMKYERGVRVRHFHCVQCGCKGNKTYKL